MTTYNKTTLKTFFETGDIPDGNDYANLIDSQVNIVETSVQEMGGPLYTPELITNRVSAANLNIGGDTFFLTIGNNANIGVGNNFIVSAANNVVVSADNNVNIYGNSFYVQGGDQLGGSYTSLSLGGTFSNISGTSTLTINLPSVVVSAMTINTSLTSTNGIAQGTGIVSAAGTTQTTAALLSNIINRGKGVTDGSATGFRPAANKTGVVQYIYNDTVSANLWPPVGGSINALGANAVFPMAANTMYTILPITASAYAVK